MDAQGAMAAVRPGTSLLGEDRGWVPPPVEDASEMAWAEYDACCSALEARLRRRPGTVRPMPAVRAAARPREAQLAGELLQQQAAAPAAAPPRPALRDWGPLSVDEVMRIARMNDRVCPVPAAWRLLYHLLPVDVAAGLRAPFPIDRLSWPATPDLHKRLRLREQLEWAQMHGALAPVRSYLQQLSESQWHHNSPAEWPMLPALSAA